MVGRKEKQTDAVQNQVQQKTAGGWRRRGTDWMMKRYRSLLMAWSFLTLLYCSAYPVYAANYGQNASQWFLDQLFWVALVVVIVAVLAMAAKRNFTGALVTAFVGAIVVFFIKNPTKLEDIGNAVMNAIGI